MDTETVNPFQSPLAVDEPAIHEQHWQPTWREVLLGLLLAPLARPLVAFAHELFALDIPDLNKLFAITALSYGMSLTAVPIAERLHRRDRLTPLAAFLAWGWIPFILGFLALYVTSTSDFTDEATGPEPITWQNCLSCLSMMGGPFVVFALYLAYLRRDETRQRSAAA